MTVPVPPGVTTPTPPGVTVPAPPTFTYGIYLDVSEFVDPRTGAPHVWPCEKISGMAKMPGSIRHLIQVQLPYPENLMPESMIPRGQIDVSMPDERVAGVPPAPPGIRG